MSRPDPLAALTNRALGLPAEIRAGLFDLDGVLTKTAELHASAWKALFDGFLLEEALHQGTEFVPFDATGDYDEYVDGRPRNDGVRSFLGSRGIALPEGGASDAAGVETVTGLGNLKNELVLELLRRKGVEAFEGSVRYVHACRAAGMPCAVVSSSANCGEVLRAAGIADLFETRVDAVVAARLGLKGKPAPDVFLAGAEALGMAPTECAVFEDALAGVAAGNAGGFGFVVGVDRAGDGRALRARGADVVVRDLADLLDAA